MKIGIISMQRVCNNGSFLQAYGLKKLIESLGHEVIFVDYHVCKPTLSNVNDRIRYYKLRCRNKLIDLFTNTNSLRCLLTSGIRNIVKKREVYQNQYLPMLGISNKRHFNTKVDALIIGSDEVFNCTQLNPEVGFSPELFGYNAHAEKVLSYAASFGNTTSERLELYGKSEEVKLYLLNFSSISVRDRNSLNIVERLIGIQPEVNLDPVLMYDFMSIVPNKEKRRGYIIIYAYRSRISKEEAEGIIEFAKKERKTLISVSGKMDWCDEHFEGSPFDVLDLFRHADYAITDTFHGTIFSIINCLKFVTLIRNSKDGKYGNQEKLQDLLERLNLTNRIYSDETDILEEKLKAGIQYEQVCDIIVKERQHTMKYLTNNLGICKM